MVQTTTSVLARRTVASRSPAGSARSVTPSAGLDRKDGYTAADAHPGPLPSPAGGAGPRVRPWRGDDATVDRTGGQARWSTCGVIAALRASTDFVICIIPCRLATQEFCSHPHHRQFRQLGKTRKCSNIENVAPDPGSCTRVMFAAAGRARIFSLYIYGSVGQDAENRRNGDSARKTISRRDLPSAIDGRPHQLVGPLASGQEYPHQGEPL